MKGNHLRPENCNKAMCGSCIFREDGKAIVLSPGRLEEIKKYTAEGTSSHICHNTGKTCFGGLTWQAKVFSAMGIIPENSVNSLLETAGKILGF